MGFPAALMPDLSEGLPFLLKQLPAELQAVARLVGTVGAAADAVGPPELPGNMRRGLDHVGRAAGVPPLLLAALAAETGGLGSPYWRENLPAVAHALGSRIARAEGEIVAGLLDYLQAADYSAAEARQLAARVVGTLLILTARELGPEGFQRFRGIFGGS